MDPIERHVYQPDVSFDGGDLDCGGGLLLLIRRHIDPMERGGLLEILSTDSTVEVELPAWCRMTKNEMVSWTKRNGQRSFLVCKGLMEERRSTATLPPPASIDEQLRVKVTIPDSLPPHLPRLPASHPYVRHGHRELAPAPLDAPGSPRQAGRAPQ